MELRTDSPEERFREGAVLTARRRDGSVGQLTVVASRPHSGRLLVTFEQIHTREDADAARGVLLLADTADLPPSQDPDEFYDHELEGLRAELVDGTAAGTVQEIVHAPGGDLLSLDYDGRTVLVPFVHEIVPVVDIAGGRVVLDPPEGLLDG